MIWTKSLPAISAGTALVVLAGAALAAQDKYSVKVPDGLALSEVRGYESWQLVSVLLAAKA